MTARRSCSSSCRRATSARRHSPAPPFPRVPRCVAHDYSCAPCLQNCLREIRTSLEKSKPLVLVQEADPAKGGGTLQALPARPKLDDPAGECALLSPHTALRGGVAAAAARQHTHSRTPSLHDCRICEHSARRASSRRSLTGGGRRRRGTASTSIRLSRLRSSPRCRHGQLPAAVLRSPRP